MLATRSRPLTPGLVIHGLLGGNLSLNPESAVDQVSTWMPRADIVERASDFVVSLDLPGVSPDSIDIQLKEDVLTISGSRSFEQESQEDRYVSKERLQGLFRRTFRLSEAIDAEGIKASSSNGVLTLILPKRPAIQPRKIQVQS